MSHSHITTQLESDNEGHVQSVPVLILLPSLILFNLAIASVTTVILILINVSHGTAVFGKCDTGTCTALSACRSLPLRVCGVDHNICSCQC